jgi:DHA1 family tetracycline resistance protein-like MFS transporter
VAYTLYGLAPQGWMLYVIIYANFLSFAVAPALQGLVSKSFDASQQGYIMGSLSAISSMIMVVTPLIGTGLLGSVSHLPPHDWRVGISFFLCSALQGAALLIAWQRLRGAVSASPAPG